MVVTTEGSCWVEVVGDRAPLRFDERLPALVLALDFLRVFGMIKLSGRGRVQHLKKTTPKERQGNLKILKDALPFNS